MIKIQKGFMIHIKYLVQNNSPFFSFTFDCEDWVELIWTCFYSHITCWFSFWCLGSEDLFFVINEGVNLINNSGLCVHCHNVTSFSWTLVLVKHPDPEPHPGSGIKNGGGVKTDPGVGLVSQPMVLLVLSLVLLVVLTIYVQRKHCVRRSGVSLSDSRRESAGVRRVQECGELVQLRRIRENSLLLLQAQYDIITAPGNWTTHTQHCDLG